MSRRPARFTESEIRKAVKAAAGEMAVEILPSGTIRLTPIAGQGLTPTQDPETLDEELAEFRARCESRS